MVAGYPKDDDDGLLGSTGPESRQGLKGNSALRRIPIPSACSMQASGRAARPYAWAVPESLVAKLRRCIHDQNPCTRHQTHMADRSSFAFLAALDSFGEQQALTECPHRVTG